MCIRDRYTIYEKYEYTLIFTVEDAENEEAALDMVLDDPFEYRDYELEEEEHVLVKQTIVPVMS